MYKRQSANTAPSYGYPVNQPAQSTPNYGMPGQQPGAPQNGAATVPAQTAPTSRTPNHAAPAPGYTQPGTQPQRGPAPAPQQGFHQQRPPMQMGEPSGYWNGTIPYNPGTAAPQMQPQQAPVQQYYPARQPIPAPPPQQAATPEPEPTGYISSKICKINAKDKVVDFSSKLFKANVKDFANVHGCGGKDHAKNSTVAVTICDFTKGTGDNSVTASYNLDAEIMDVLYEAAMNARLGQLRRSTSDLVAAASVALHELHRWELAGQQQPVSVIPFSELTATGTALGNAASQNDPVALKTIHGNVLTDLRRWAGNRKQCPSAGVPLRDIYEVKNALEAALSDQGKPLFEYVTEKNIPYDQYRDAEGRYPVSKLCITYTPFRKGGEVSRYPWFIQIENFRAPLTTKANGASSHDASRAVDRKAVSIFVSADDFAASMVAVRRYIRIWEMVETIPVVRSGLRWLERIRASKQNKKEN